MTKSWILSMGLSALLCLTNLFAKSQCTIVGWASQNGGVTGGGTATPTVVTNYNDLKTAITSSSVKVVHISGTITIPSAGRISLQDQSGKTIYGLPGSKLVSNDQTKANSGILYVKRCSNIIFRNVTLEGPGAYDTDGWDNMTLDNSTNIWVDHCEFQDGMDGNLDIKNAADYVTVTWCKFIYNKAPTPGGPGGSDDHRFSDLFGSSDGATGDRGKLRVTMQHCWWAQGCKERMPRVRFGKVHMVNNLFNSTVASKCVTAGFEADLLVESNVFENVSNSITTMDNTFTAVTSRNNIFTNTSGDTTNSGTAFTPPYTLTITPAANVKSLVMASAGATLTSPSCDSAATTPVTYTLTTTAAPTTGGTITGAGTYDSATVVTVTATAATGYTFTGWSGDVSDTTAAATITMSGNKSVTANFQALNTDSSTTPADSIPTGDSTTIRIEDDATTTQGLCSYDGAISTNSGASNGKVINLANASGKGVTWKVNVPAAGTYSINWRYVNSSSSNTYSMALIINGTTINNALPFPKTSSSTVFANVTTTISLNAGDNTIRLQSTTSTATADIDWIEITGNTPVAANCNGTTARTAFSAASSQLTHSVTKTSVYPNPTNGKATITVTLGKNEQAVIRLYDAQGSVVANLGTISSVTGGIQQIPCNLNSKPGLYYVVVIGNKGLKATHKLVIE
ncbi:pectate lyase [Chitinophaga sp. CF118]|uniref:pectate lyase family protein n=1 Tax=Chitinophaga sp. CF118 TaxID=1884367 RepID=UPI0008EF5740|nr:CBM35 domain-containing protein [Chitinophaga sp. CF118]SFE50659.1 pectate lyase [Chitinophaga sp. CF118]